MAATNGDGQRPYVQDALRVSQLDASELDTELFELFKNEIKNVFKYFKPTIILEFSPEISAALRYLLWHYSIQTADSTIGQKLLGLRYANDDAANQQEFWMTRKQKLLYALFTIGGPWLEERIDDIDDVTTRKIPHLKKMWSLFRIFAKFYKIASLVSFLVFICYGKRQFLTERLLGVTAVFPRVQSVRQVGFEMMNRELLWHGFAEFLFFTLSSINFRCMKNFLMKHLVPGTSTSVEEERSAADYRECATCGEFPFNPHQIGCRHVFCYYCIWSNHKADPSYVCPLCQKKITTEDDIIPVPIKSTTISSPSS